MNDEALVIRAAECGIPRGYREVGLDNLLLQQPHEPFDVFADRVVEAHALGVTDENRTVYLTLARWDPPVWSRLQDWVVLHGPPGSGKTALLGAIGRRLLTEQGMQRIPIPRDELVRQYGEARADRMVAMGRGFRVKPASYRSVRYVVLPELVRAEQRSQSYSTSRVEDVDSMPGCKAVQVLLLDELGADAEPPAREVRLVEELLDHRADHRLLTVLATNRQPSELTDPKRGLYGARVADRLRAARWLHVAGPSWRGLA